MGKRILFLLIVIAPFLGKAQLPYDPTKAGTALNKGIANTGVPTDARGWFYDQSLFTSRPFNSTAEVLAYYNTSLKRAGNFFIFVRVGSQTRTYMFRDGTADGNLVIVDNIDATSGVTSWAGKTGVVIPTASDVNLGSVTNESKTTMFNNPTFTGIANIPSGSILTNPRLGTSSTLNWVWTASGTDGSGSWQPTQALGGTVTKLNNQTGDLTAGYPGGTILSNVENTRDKDKIISDQTQAALDLKASAATLSSHIANLSNPHQTTKAQIGLSSVQDLAPSAMPVSTAQQTALNLKADAASPVLSGTITGTYTLGGTPSFPSTVTQNAASQTLTNKTISGSSNTLSNIGVLSITPTSTTIPIAFSTGTGVNIPIATSTAAGGITANDRKRLDSNYYALQSASGVAIVNFVDAQTIRYKPITCTGCTATNVGDTLVNISVSGAPTGWQSLTDGATIAFDMNNGSKGKVTLGGNRTLSITNASDGAEIMIKITQDASGNRTLALPAGSKVSGGGNGVVTLSTASGAVDILTGVLDGSTWYWTYGKTFN